MQATSVYQNNKKTCCGCLDLKAGSFLAGGYSLTLSVLGILGCVLFITLYLPNAEVPMEKKIMAEKDWDKEFPQYTHEQIEAEVDKQVHSALETLKVTFEIAAFMYGLWFLFSILLLVGVAISNQGCLLAWFIYTIILSVISGIGIVNFLIHAKTTFSDGPHIGGFAISVVNVLLNIYAIWCVAAHRTELRGAPVSQVNMQDGYSGPGYKRFVNVV